MLDGVNDTETVGFRYTKAVTDHDGFVMLVAVTVNVWGDAIVAGAV